MTTANSRQIIQNQTVYYMPMEPDGKHVRLDCKFDSGGDKLTDYSYMNNEIDVGYLTEQPMLLKNTDDDGITGGEIVTKLDGEQHYYRVIGGPKNQIKQMILDGEPGITIVYRTYIIKLENELNSSNTRRATLFYEVDNDQIEYAIKAETTDSGILHFYFKYGSTVYHAHSSVSQVVPRDLPDFRYPDFDPDNFDAQSEFVFTYPLDYQDFAFSFNFATKQIRMFTDGVEQTVVNDSNNPSPSPFPVPFVDPPPPPETPAPFIQPFTQIYNQQVETAQLKINSVTTSPQLSIYSLPGGDPVTDPQILKYNVQPGTQSPSDPIISLGGVDTTDDSWVPLCKATTDANNCSIAAVQFINSTSGLGKSVIGKVINDATFWLNGVNGPVGNVYYKIWDGSGKEIYTLGSNPASETDGVILQLHIHDPNNTTVMQTGYRIGVEYTQGSTTDIIKVQRNNTDKDPSVVQSVKKPGGTTFSQNTTYDLRCAFSTGAGLPGTQPYLQMFNGTDGASSVSEYFQPNSPIIGITPTLIEFKVFRDSSTTTLGTVFLRHLASDFSVKATLTSASVSTLPTSDPGVFNFTWQDLNYYNPILANESIAIEITGVTKGFVYVLTNWNNTHDNDYDGPNSFWAYKYNGTNNWVTSLNLDLSGRISKGGSVFTGYISLDDKRKRTGIVLAKTTSSLIGKQITRVLVPMKRFGVNTLSGLGNCVIRDKTGVLKTTMGTFDPSTLNTDTDTSLDFINTLNTYTTQLGDVISVEYDNGNTTDQIMVRTIKDAFESDSTILFEGISTSINTATPVLGIDMAGTVFVGGITDSSARPIRGVKIANTNSVLNGKVITEVRLKLKATGSIPLLQSAVYVWIINVVDGTIESELGSLDFNSIPTTQFTEFVFQNTANTYVMKTGDRIDIAFEYGDISNFVEIKVSGTNTFDGNNTIMTEYNGRTFSDVTGQDLTGSMYIGGFLVTPDPGTPTPPTPYHYNHGWILSASLPPDSNAIADPLTLNPPTNSYLYNISKQFRIYSSLLTANQLQNYFENRWTISALPFGKITVVGHHIIPWNSALV